MKVGDKVEAHVFGAWRVGRVKSVRVDRYRRTWIGVTFYYLPETVELAEGSDQLRHFEPIEA